MKLFKIRHIITCMAIAGLALQSCNKLDLKPTDTIDPEKAYRNLNDIDMAIKGAYAGMTYTLISNSVTVSDEAILPAENVVSNTSAYRWQYNSASSTVTSSFGELYVVIDRANRALAGLELLNNVDVQKKNHFKGELLAIRAYAHLELLRAFSAGYAPTALAIPYILKAETGSPKRNTVQEVIAFLNTDLNDALALIGDTDAGVKRITKTGVYAIQARTALYAQDWDKAIAAATAAIQAKPLASAANFAKIWTDASEQEVIFALGRKVADLPVDDDDTREGPIGAVFYRQSGDYALYTPSNKLMNLYDKDNDVRFASYVSYEPDRGAGKESYLIGKYKGRSEDTFGLVNIKLFRTGEMYLIRAEAYAQKDKLAEAAADLNDLRSARIDGYQSETFAGKEPLINAIFTERYKELAFEGHRFFDLKRRNVAIERSALDAVNTNGNLRLEPTKAQYNFPIPAVEMSVNKAMQQNPGYGKD